MDEQVYIDLLETEQKYLWSGLESSLRYANNGYWSEGALFQLLRIVRIAKVIGPTPFSSVPTALWVSKVYQEILLHFNIGHAHIPDHVFEECKEHYVEDYELKTIPRIRELDKEGYL